MRVLYESRKSNGNDLDAVDANIVKTPGRPTETGPPGRMPSLKVVQFSDRAKGILTLRRNSGPNRADRRPGICLIGLVAPLPPKGGNMFTPIRILAVTVAACGCLFVSGPARAADRDGNELAQPTRKPHHSRPQAKPAEAAPSREASPQARPEAEKPSAPEGKPSEEEESSPDENEEVSPGDSPVSCDGCELAGIVLGGSLWGLFGVSRRRGVPSPVIRGFQPR